MWGEASCMLQWSLSGHQLVCISISQETITQTTKENLKWKTFTTYSILFLQTPFEFWINMKFLKILYVSFKWYFWQKKPILMSVLGLNSKDSKSTRDKANISNPKVNRGCVPLIANCISADCVQISFGPSIPCILLGVCDTGGFNAM